MVCGVVSWAPNPADGWIFFVEPTRSLASTIIAFNDELSARRRCGTRCTRSPPSCSLSAALLSFGGWAAKQPMRRYGAQGMSASCWPTPGSRAAAAASAPESPPWRLRDRIGLAFAWLLGLLFCAVAVAIVVYFLVAGHKLRAAVAVRHQPEPPDSRPRPRAGSSIRCWAPLLVTVLAMMIALPSGSRSRVWLSEYGRPAALARVAESTIEMIAGTPSIVLALFGIILFQSPVARVSQPQSGGMVFGTSFFAAGAMLSLVALPLVVANVREGLQSIPNHVREASYALGKTKIATTRRILLPAARPSVLTGAMLGAGRVIGDTAIIVVLLGGHADLQRRGLGPAALDAAGHGQHPDLLRLLQRAHGRGQPADKAYAAAFVLLMFVLALNVGVDVATRRSRRLRWSS